MVQHGLQQVQDIIEKVHDTVDFLNAMGKIEKLLEILKMFKATTNIISGSEYLTANLFLGEVQRIKVLLDVKSESLDDFVKSMVANMKERFTKYWGECNLLMAIGTVMDPRLKMRAVEIAFPKMFPSDLVRENIGKVKDIIYQLFVEYLRIYSSTCNVEESGECAFPTHGGDVTSSGLSELLQDVFSGETSIPRVKNELDLYLDEGCIFSQDVKFDAITWWREKSNKFRILSKMAVTILAVPITTVASEATLSDGSRVIDPYRASLAPETVQMLMCTGDWCRSLHGVKRKNKTLRKSKFQLVDDEWIRDLNAHEGDGGKAQAPPATPQVSVDLIQGLLYDLNTNINARFNSMEARMSAFETRFKNQEDRITAI
ncbi:hypothetical protein GQ457_01G015440 [Hibiscus cannabinus]